MRRFNTSSSSSSSNNSTKAAAAAAAASQPPPPNSSSSSSSLHRPISIRRPFSAPRPDTTTTTIARRPPPRPPFAAQSFQSKTGPRPPAKTASSPSSSATSSITSSDHHRPPLRLKDRNQLQNAPILTASPTTRSTIASAAKMPIGDRPRQPQLGPAAVRSAKRSPLTPKIAAKGPPSAASVRRPLSVQAQRDDAPAHVSSHVTPRSGPRQGRVDSPGSTSTPSHHPERLAYDAWDNGGARAGVGGAPASASGSSSRQPGDSPGDQQSESHKFFYASDAKAIQRPLSVPQKPVAFFYANGASAEAKRTTSPPLNQAFTPVLPPTHEPVATKFFYANGTPDLPPPRHALVTSASASALSTNARSLVRPGTSSSATAFAAPASQRPVSPIKTTAPPATQSLSANALLPASPNQPLSLQSSPALAPAAHSSGRRRVSIDMAPRLIKQGHSRTGSASTVDVPVASRFAASPTSSQPASPPQSPGLMQPAMTMASLIQAAEEWKERDTERDGDAQPELSQSPTKSSHAGEPISELVANARRERKVQDLEITNASLEAINRTLERQLRKQTIELRRYRRMSRAGHISLVSSRVPSAALTDAAMDLSGVDEEDEATEDEQDEYLDSLDESDFSSNESLSADLAPSPNNKLVARRKRDERRLQIDLTKHQELLVDSQKMNQSLKRCLDWTEVLIREGQKALAYNVRVSDVELGGRVLTPLDEDDEDDGPRLGPPRTKGSQDRDSGVELPGDGG